MERGHSLAETKAESDEFDALTGTKDVVKVANGGRDEAGRDGELTVGLTTKVLRTLAMIAAWICMGLFSEVTGPTLPSLRRRIAVDYEEISRALVARSVGFLVASLLGGMLCERFRRLVDVWMAAALAVAAVATAAVPWCHSLPALCVALCADGMGKGVLGAGGSSFIIRLWGSQADVPVQSLHLAFGVGALVAPQIARPFLVAAPSVGPSSVTSDIDAIRSTDAAFADVNATWRSTYDATNATSADVVAVSAIEYPYSIIAALTALVAAAFLVLACASPLPSSRASPRPPRLSDLLSPHRWLPSSRRRALGLAILAALFLFFTLPVGAERSFGRFLYAFAVEGAPRLPPAAATALESVFWTSFTVGRGTATVLARWVPAAPLLALELSLTLSAAVALLAGANTHPALLWGGTAAFGAGLAPLFPTAIVWANAYVDMAGMMTSVAFVAAATGAFVFSWLAGYLFQYAGPSSVLTFAVVFAVIAVVVFATLRVLASFYGPRYRSVPIDDLQLKVVDGPRTPMLRSREPHATP